MDHPAFDLKQNEAGKWYFNIIAANNQVLATSEPYSSKKAAEKGIDSTIRNVSITLRESTKSLPPRSNIAIRLSTLKKLGIETMHDVATALHEGKLVLEESD